MGLSPDAFFSQFAELYQSGRLEDLHELYDEPVVWVGPFGTRVFDKRDDFLAEIAQIRDVYETHGLAAARSEVLEVRTFAPGLICADLGWRFFAFSGKQIDDFKSSYVLRRAGDDYRVTVHISHDEVFQRPIGSASHH